MAEQGATQDRKQKKTISMRTFIVCVIIVAGIGFIGGVYRYQLMAVFTPLLGDKAVPAELNLSTLQHTYRELVRNYDGTIDATALVNGANRGMVEAAGDKYTVYMDSAETAQFEMDLSGSIGGGVGVAIQEKDKTIRVKKVLAGTPAEAAGIKPGDSISKINNDTTEGMSADDAVQKIRGAVGTTVRLAYVRDAAPEQSVTITRQEITSPSVESQLKDGYGIVTVSRFDQDTGPKVRSAVASLKSQGAKGFILDLRGNGGGYVTAAESVAGVWLNDKIVVSERTGDRVIDEPKTGNRALLEGIPTVVLIDGASASASEIVAGALQEYGAATVIGEQSYGKGTVQRLISLPDGAQLKVTIARWYTPKGKNITETGITPDKKIELSNDDIAAERDTQLQAALDDLKAR